MLEKSAYSPWKLLKYQWKLLEKSLNFVWSTASESANFIVCTPSDEFQFTCVQMTPCCSSPIHKQCREVYVASKNCIVCDMPLEKAGERGTKPCFDLELTLHHTMHRYNVKDRNHVPRHFQFPNIFYKKNKVVPSRVFIDWRRRF